MFNSFYDFHLIDHKQLPDGGACAEYWLYNFQSDRRRYIARVELYDGHIYILKYHADCHSASKHRYNLLMNDERPAPIIRTCINIMLMRYQANRNASFGFVGSHSVNKFHDGKLVAESRANTQRFRIYQSVMFNFFGQQTFERARSVAHSAYLMINRQNNPVGEFRKKAEKMFGKIYLSFDN